MKILTSLLVPVPAVQAQRPETESARRSEQTAATAQQSLHANRKELLSARQLLHNEPEVDEQKIAACSAELQTGTYRVDTDELARAMLDFHRHGR